MKAYDRRLLEEQLRYAEWLETEALTGDNEYDLSCIEEAAEIRDNVLNTIRANKILKAHRDAGRHRVRARDLPDVKNSWWRWLLRCGSNGAFIRFLGLSRKLFDELVDIARSHPEYVERLEGRVGRPRKMGSMDDIGLALRYIFGMSESVGLMSAFFVSSSTIQKSLEKGLELLLYSLDRHEQAAVLWPSFQEQIAAAHAIASAGGDVLPEGLSSVKPFICENVSSRTRLLLCTLLPHHRRRQSHLRYAWTRIPTSLFFTLLCAGVDGTYFQVPKSGSWNKEIERMYYSKKSHMNCINCVFALTLPFYVSFGDVAFKGETADGSTPAYLTPATAADLVNNKEDVRHRLALTYWVLRKRQAIEWCMSTLKVRMFARLGARSVTASARSQARVAPFSFARLPPIRRLPSSPSMYSQRTFRRLNTVLPGDNAKRERLCCIITMLHNLRVRNGARTQLSTVYWNSSAIGHDALEEEDRMNALRETYFGAAATKKVTFADLDDDLDSDDDNSEADDGESEYEGDDVAA